MSSEAAAVVLDSRKQPVLLLQTLCAATCSLAELPRGGVWPKFNLVVTETCRKSEKRDQANADRLRTLEMVKNPGRIFCFFCPPSAVGNFSLCL